MDLLVEGVAFLIGILVATIIFAPSGFGWGLKDRNAGVLRVITSDPDGPYIFLESHISIGELVQKKEVVFKVDASDLKQPRN